MKFFVFNVFQIITLSELMEIIIIGLNAQNIK